MAWGAVCESTFGGWRRNIQVFTSRLEFCFCLVRLICLSGFVRIFGAELALACFARTAFSRLPAA